MSVLRSQGCQAFPEFLRDLSKWNRTTPSRYHFFSFSPGLRFRTNLNKIESSHLILTYLFGMLDESSKPFANSDIPYAT